MRVKNGEGNFRSNKLRWWAYSKEGKRERERKLFIAQLFAHLHVGEILAFVVCENSLEGTCCCYSNNIRKISTLKEKIYSTIN